MVTKSAKRVYLKTKGRRTSLKELENLAAYVNAVESGVPIYAINRRLMAARRQAALDKAFGKKR